MIRILIITIIITTTMDNDDDNHHHHNNNNNNNNNNNIDKNDDYVNDGYYFCSGPHINQLLSRQGLMNNRELNSNNTNDI